MILTLTQTVDNACASVALLNIVNNISNADLGEHLRRFKEFTRTFTPALRGDAIGNFEFVKQIHNSFARLVRCLDLRRFSFCIISKIQVMLCPAMT